MFQHAIGGLFSFSSVFVFLTTYFFTHIFLFSFLCICVWRTPHLKPSMSTLAYDPSTTSYPSTTNDGSSVADAIAVGNISHLLVSSSFQDQKYAIIPVTPSGSSAHRHPDDPLVACYLMCPNPPTSLPTTFQCKDHERYVVVTTGRLQLIIPMTFALQKRGIATREGYATRHGGDINNNNNDKHSRTSMQYPKFSSARGIT
jgi:hypothetical protein